MVEAGALRVVVDSRYPLAGLRAAVMGWHVWAELAFILCVVLRPRLPPIGVRFAAHSRCL